MEGMLPFQLFQAKHLALGREERMEDKENMSQRQSSKGQIIQKTMDMNACER
jgi:hypothetical protein